MRKRSRRTYAKQEDDVISQHPDDVLLEIINRLNSLIEAATTSALSARWRYMWTFCTNLNFDPPRSLCKSLSEVHVSKPQYVNWVDKVLELHTGSALKEFRRHYELYHPDSNVLTNWIHAAIAKGGGVQHFMLKLNIEGAGKNPMYAFSQECYNSLRSTHGLSFAKSLKSLSLTNANVTEVEISAPSLSSFKIYGADIVLKVENVRQLLDVPIGGYCYARLKKYIESIMNYLPQLHTLELRLHMYFHPTGDAQFPFCELPKVRHLIFCVGAFHNKNFLGLTRMIEACPCLEKFTLKLVHYGHSPRRKIKEFPKCGHEYQQLKVVEFPGFVGRPIDLELAFYFLEKAVMLEKMIVNPILLFSLGLHIEVGSRQQKRR